MSSLVCSSFPRDVIPLNVGDFSAWAAGNSLVFGEYILRAANVEPGRWTLRLVGFACVTFAMVLHGTALKWGLRLQNVLGIFKIIILVFIIITGFVALGGHLRIEKPHNFTNAFEGTTASASSFCLSLYNVCPFFIAPCLTITLCCRLFGHTSGSAMSTTHFLKSKILSVPFELQAHLQSE